MIASTSKMQLQRLRESSLGSLNSSRANNNSNKTQEERSSLGELTPRTCKSKSEETGSHPELEPEELEQIEAKQDEQEKEEQEEEAAQLAAQQKGPAEAAQLAAQQKGPTEQQATTTTASSLQKHMGALLTKTASKTQEMVLDMLEKRTYNRSLLVQ